MGDDGGGAPAAGISGRKAEGAFLAFAAGDALGWPQEMRGNGRSRAGEVSAHVEFRGWTRRSGGRFGPYEEIIRPGEYSDDTQLTLAVARCRTNYGGEWWQALTRVELPLWTLYERGGGAATKRSAAAWARNCAPWRSNRKEDVGRYFAAGGNGVAMRVLPHALFLGGEETAATLVHDVVLDGSATHGHPRALVGASAYAYAAWCLARRRSRLGFGELLETLIDDASEWSAFPKPDRDRGGWFEAAKRATETPYDMIWDRTADEMRRLLQAAQRGIRAGALADDHSVLKDLGCFGPTKGVGTSSAAAAAYLAARHATQPIQGILSAAFEMGADTDTLAAMAGGLMGCLAGVDWIPGSWLRVQDANYLRDIASRVVAGPKEAHQRLVEPVHSLKSVSFDRVEDTDQEIKLGGVLPVRATALPDPNTVAKSMAVRSWRLSTSYGQTMYVTKVHRRPMRQIGSRAGDTAANRVVDSVGRLAEDLGHYGAESADLLYSAFCDHLQVLAGGGELKRRDVETKLGLVRSQVTEWLKRAEQDGRIQWTSKNPAKFTVSGTPK